MNVAQPLIQASLIGEAIDAGPILVFVADEEMQYVAVNDYACAALGYQRAELLALSVPDVAPGPETERTYRQFLRAGEMAGTTTLRAKDGRALTFAYRACRTTIAGLPLFVSAGWLEA
ncbi:MAG TPA: PAS domain-containing protein [Gaiellaceae bacterium]|nr:PAS domain-containing protein [Gaiellaceae bacterium]